MPVLSPSLDSPGRPLYNQHMPARPHARAGRCGTAIVAAALALCQTARLYFIDRDTLGRGLPIDDAYIFLQYAKNLAAGAGFSFNPGETSFGCTSLVWPLLLAAGRRLTGADPIALALFFGAVLFALAAGGTAALVGARTGKTWPALAAGVLVAASPTLVMNAVSGMETPLTMALLVLYAALVTADRPRPLALGIVAGAMTLNRPESLYFGPGAALLWLGAMAIQRRIQWRPLLWLLLPWALLCVPAAALIHARTGGFLPTTYMGKMIAGGPDALERGLPVRLLFAALSLGDGWWKLRRPLGPLAPALLAGILFAAWRAAAGLRRAEVPAGSGWGRLVLFGYLFLPAAYGFFFPVHPPFGGYYFRYIAPVVIAGTLLGVWGLAELGEWVAEQNSLDPRRRLRAALLAAVVLVGGQALLWRDQMPEATEVFRREVRLNTGLRREAGTWIAGNVPPAAKVMVGYTGLGVVGYYGNHYVLDLGALINPDIFPFYRAAGRGPEKRRRAIVEYMDQRGVEYYVTFAFPPGGEQLVADPARDPRFVEAARIGSPGEPAGPYEQVRVYRLSGGR